MLERLAQEGIYARAAWYPGEQRTCLSVVDPAANSLTEIYENSAFVPAESWQEFESSCEAVMAQQAGWVALCGSLPEGAPAGGMARLAEACRAAPAARLVVDTAGKNLAPLLAANPWLVKINRHEAGELLGVVPCSLSEGVAACRAIQQRGARSVVITFGSRGWPGWTYPAAKFAGYPRRCRLFRLWAAAMRCWPACSLGLRGVRVLARQPGWARRPGRPMCYRSAPGASTRKKSIDYFGA